jgi:arylsulfatase A-like enzyme
VVGALATYLQKGPWGVKPFTWPLVLAIGGGGAVAVVLLVRGLGRLSARGMRMVRIGLAVGLVTGFAWMPLFGPHGGILRNRGSAEPAAGAKNVILFIVDTLRSDYLDCYGGEWNASPVVNRLASGGALFENNIAQCTWTLPSTTSILTGLFPSTHGAVATGMSLASSAPTLSEVLQNAGYRTAAFTENAYLRPQYGFGRGFGYFWTYWLPWAFEGSSLNRVLGNLRLPSIKFTNKDAYITIPNITHPDGVNWDARAATDRVLEWLRKDPDAPFFAYVHYMGPHSPYGPREYLLDREPPSRPLTDYPRPMGGAFPLGEPGGRATEAEIEEMKVLYAADILCVDHHIGRIVEWLEENGKLSETVIAFTADHGEEFLEHGSWCHGSSAFTEVARIPFVLYDEGSVPAGVRVRDTTRQIDLMPTVLDLVGLKCPDEIQGRSVRPLVDGVPLASVPAYIEVYPAVPPGADIYAFVNDRHKLVRVSLDDRSAVLLYDLENDPGEKDNLADVYPALRDSLLVEMEKWDQIARANSPIDSERLKYFRSLGYINH